MLMLIILDIMMAIIFFVIGLAFYKSNGKAAEYLTGYNTRTKEERKKYDENEMCKKYGKRMMFMSIPFIIGSVIDFKFVAIGTFVAWGIWFIMFILLLIERNNREK